MKSFVWAWLNYASETNWVACFARHSFSKPIQSKASDILISTWVLWSVKLLTTPLTLNNVLLALWINQKKGSRLEMTLTFCVLQGCHHVSCSQSFWFETITNWVDDQRGQNALTNFLAIASRNRNNKLSDEIKRKLVWKIILEWLWHTIPNMPYTSFCTFVLKVVRWKPTACHVRKKLRQLVVARYKKLTSF